MRLDEIERGYFNEISIQKEIDNARGILEGYVTDDINRALNFFGDYTNVDDLEARLSRYERIAVITDIRVEGEKGKGLGTAMFSGAIEEAAQAGTEVIVLLADIYEENDFDLVQWYEGWGFQTVGDTFQGPIMMMEV